MKHQVRVRLPRPDDRIQLRDTALQVSPVCIGITGSDDTVVKAYEAGVNFFFVSGDLHWPLYEHTRRGLRRLLEGNRSRRDEIVVAAASYLDEPLFRELQFNEIIDSVPGLDRIDVLIAGAVESERSLLRARSLDEARRRGHLGAAATGASFHDRGLMLKQPATELLDIHYVRYNAAHCKARTDLFPRICDGVEHLTYVFKSQVFRVSEEVFRQLELPKSSWLPTPADCYRFSLTPRGVSGLLCAPRSTTELKELLLALKGSPLTSAEQKYFLWLTEFAFSTKRRGTTPEARS